MKKIFIASAFSSLLLFSACQSAEPIQKENEAESKDVDEVQEEDEAQALLEEDLQWMEEKNEDTISKETIILNRENEPIGPTISYSLMEEEDISEEEKTGHSELYASFGGDKFKFELGFFAPNAHGLNIQSLHDKERDNQHYDLPHDSIFNKFIEIDDPLIQFAPNSKWEVTAADLTGNGMLEIIHIVQVINDGTTYETVAGVYEYTGDVEEPFELVAHFNGKNKASMLDQHIYFTKGLEFVHDSYDTDTVLAFFEDNQWYNKAIEDGENEGTATLFDYDSDGEIVIGSESTSSRNEEGNQTSETDEDILTDPDEIDTYADQEEAAGLDALEYVSRSTMARDKDDYEQVYELVKPNSPIDEELKKLIENDTERGLDITHNGGEVIKTDIITSGEVYDVLIRQSFDIYGVEKEGERFFESEYRMEYDSESGNFQAVELLDEKEI